jgi:hypothetical protein
MLMSSTRFGIYGHQNPHHLAYTLTYLATCSGSANIFIGELVNVYPLMSPCIEASLIFHRTLRFDLVIPLIWGQRRHRSNFSFMSNRRLNRVCGKLCFTVFIMGFRSRSLPVGTCIRCSLGNNLIMAHPVVDSDTAVGNFHSHLRVLGVVPGSQF